MLTEYVHLLARLLSDLIHRQSIKQQTPTLTTSTNVTFINRSVPKSLLVKKVKHTTGFRSTETFLDPFANLDSITRIVTRVFSPSYSRPSCYLSPKLIIIIILRHILLR